MNPQKSTEIGLLLLARVGVRGVMSPERVAIMGPRLLSAVEDGLAQRWSPQETAGRLRRGASCGAS
jgi:hypothetical protein